MKNFLTLLCVLSFIFVPFVYAQNNFFLEKPKTFRFFEIKKEIQAQIINAAKKMSDTDRSKKKNIEHILLELEDVLKEIRKKYSNRFEFAIHAYGGNINRADLVLNIFVDYKDQKGKIIWGFPTYFFKDRIDFYMGVTGEVDNKDLNSYYNWLTLFSV